MGRKDDVMSTWVRCELTEASKLLLKETTCITDTKMEDEIVKC
jgi:hypothetical protein